MTRTALALLAIAGPLAAQVETALDRFNKLEATDKFRLLNYCQPLEIDVELRTKDAEGFGLTQRRMETKLEARLRAARLYSDGPQLMGLALTVHVVGIGWRADLVAIKPMEDTLSNARSRGISWWRAETGTASSSDTGGQFVLGVVDDMIDGFLAEYLRINEAPCANRWRREDAASR